jgi:hypothetical protein
VKGIALAPSSTMKIGTKILEEFQKFSFLTASIAPDEASILAS